ncbi:MAG: hypothetical protein NDI94_06635, partial [Candidatus Woesearchaeota archaeon]|nr:hypothetical protein [Candidatus Woesearchaeota archaeon]
ITNQKMYNPYLGLSPELRKYLGIWQSALYLKRNRVELAKISIDMLASYMPTGNHLHPMAVQYSFTSYLRRIILPIPYQVSLDEIAASQIVDAKELHQSELRTYTNLRLALRDDPYSIAIENCFTKDDAAFQRIIPHVSDAANAVFLHLRPKLEHPGGYLMYPQPDG